MSDGTITDAAAKPESMFPTLRDFRDRLSELIEQGMGDLPAQILVVPDSTLQALAHHLGDPGAKPALMIELGGDSGNRLPVCVISTDNLSGRGMPTRARQ